jgi:hypothetical protein
LCSRLGVFKIATLVCIQQIFKLSENILPGVKRASLLRPARFCRQVAACAPDIFCNFCLVENCKIANNYAAAKAREKNNHIFGILTFFWLCLTKCKNYQILLNKISHKFLVTTMLLSGWKILIVTDQHLDLNTCWAVTFSLQGEANMTSHII